jgi:hypothetical protein
VILSTNRDGLLRYQVTCPTQNPKDPPVMALFDTGANCNIVQANFFKTLIISDKNILPDKMISFANTSTLQTRCQRISMNFSIIHENESHEFSSTFLICDISETIILGRPFLDSSGLTHLVITKATNPNPFSSYSCKSITIEIFDDKDGEGEDEVIIDIEMKPYDDDTENIWESFSSQYGINSHTLFNAVHYAALHMPDVQISKLLANITEVMKAMPKTYQITKDDIVIKRHASIHAPWKEVNKAVFTIQNAFNTIWNIRRLGLANFDPMIIDFDWESYKQIRMNPQNLNPVMKAALKDELKVFEKAMLVEDVPSADMTAGRIALSPMDLIKKPTPNKFRCITDFKRSTVNKYSKIMNYAAPNADAHLDSVAGKDILSIADAKSFFWQLPLAEASRNVCAFFTQLGIQRYCAVPQGHINSASHCAQVVDNSLRIKEQIERWGAYVDDFNNGEKFGEGQQKFFAFLEAMIEFHAWALRMNVRFDPENAKLGYSQIELLGFTCSKEGKSISSSRTAALKNLKVPDSKELLLHFLGCYVFIARWIPRYAEYAAPLYSMLKKGIRFVDTWGPAHEAAVTHLKRLVDQAPILRTVCYSTTLFLRSDGSGIAIAAVIFQIVDGKELPAAYGSKVLTKAQRDWPIVQVEFFAIIFFVRRWKSIMQGHPNIVIEMDARNLLWARTSVNEMIRRWVNELDSLMQIATIKHIVGSSNQPSDGLSRCFQLTILDDLSSPNELDLHELVCNTAAIKIETKLVETLPDEIEIMKQSHTDEILMSKDIHILISLAHNDEIGHAGCSGTMWVMRRANLHKHSCFTSMKHMSDCVESFIKGCPICQLTYLILHSKYQGHDMVSHEYFNTIDMDFCYIGEDRNGYSQILGIRDRLTRYVEAFACKTSTAEEFAPHMLAVGSRYGFFESVCMDNAEYFVQDCIDEMLILMGTNRKRIIPYRPQANPMERSNKDILRHMRALCLCRPEISQEWSVFLPIVLSIINGTFNATTHSTPAQMIYGDNVNRLRGILLPFGSKHLRTDVGTNYSSRVSNAHAHLMAAAEDYQQQRLCNALEKMPPFSLETIYQIGDYVVADLKSMRRNKTQPQYRGVFMVIATSGDNHSVVHCRCPVTNTVHEIHAEDLRLLDLRILQQTEEVTALAAQLLNKPEYIVTSISDHRISATRSKADNILDTDLPAMEFYCHYKDGQACWNNYNDVSHLLLMQTYLRNSRKQIPDQALNGKAFEDCVVPSLKHFAKHFNININGAINKHQIIKAIRLAIANQSS